MARTILSGPLVGAAVEVLSETERYAVVRGGQGPNQILARIPVKWFKLDRVQRPDSVHRVTIALDVGRIGSPLDRSPDVWDGEAESPADCG